MLDLIFKQLGLKPDEIKNQIEQGGLLVKTAAETLERIEKKLDEILQYDKSNRAIQNDSTNNREGNKDGN